MPKRFPYQHSPEDTLESAILVEGNVERLLLPLMIEKEAKTLRSAALCILEVGGAFGHRFAELIHFLGITTLVITDLDSVQTVEPPDNEGDEDEKEFEVPAEAEGQPPAKRYGKTCEPSEVDAVTANQTLIQWLPKKLSVAELLAASPDEKIEAIPDTEHAKVRIAYQTPTNVVWAQSQSLLCGRTLEVSFGLENASWCQETERKTLGLKLRGQIPDVAALATGLHKRVIGQYFDKTKFALGVLARKQDEWTVPRYIAEGLKWLESLVNLEAAQEIQATASVVPAEALTHPEPEANT